VVPTSGEAGVDPGCANKPLAAAAGLSVRSNSAEGGCCADTICINIGLGKSTGKSPSLINELYQLDCYKLQRRAGMWYHVTVRTSLHHVGLEQRRLQVTYRGWASQTRRRRLHFQLTSLPRRALRLLQLHCSTRPATFHLPFSLPL
jgi:hypothetical protein